MSNLIKNQLLHCVKQITSYAADYVYNPSKDFTRSRKLGFDQVLLTLLEMGGQTLSRELLQLGHPISNSAFVQSRYKVKPEAFQALFHAFTKEIYPTTDYPILAVYGTDLNIPVNPGDPDSYCSSNTGGRAYNLLHLNALYDLTQGLYLDARIQPRRQMDERRAVIDMMESSPFR
ncbi:hypothetical protein IYQ92_06525 [Streptococcus sp. HF-1907]|uniref:hypothetical protein n=1 Tax=Streptococcus sp. HF-1907 TaxID=2785793 RepID=UPI00189D8B06|nr:hypothetical protein [Streptococcus sp. HF-1907]MBF7094899.1 hypothetical protein [Streptococcus sp. HF-1907]